MCRWLLVRLAAMLPVVLSWGCARGESVEQGRGDSGSDASTDGEQKEASESDGSSHVCDGVVCDDPPKNTCADAQHLTVYDTIGVCDEAGCHYAFHVEECLRGCQNDGCVGEPCVGVKCDKPPDNECADEHHLTVFEVPGRCEEGQCIYDKHEQYCANGCEGGGCQGDPCAGVSCLTPPANYCTDADHLEAFDGVGTCEGGVCGYGHHNEYCEHGCSAGACQGDPCAGVSCLTPPSNYCLTQDTLRRFSDSGQCSNGSCVYASTDIHCPFGCSQGACRECLGSTDCGAGRWCHDGNCEPCHTDQHCGASCVDCTTQIPAKKCDAVGSSCIECVSDADCGSGKWCDNHVCAVCNTAAHCGSQCVACSGATPECDGSACYCPSGTCVTCPTSALIGAWDSGDDGWSWDGLWRRDKGYLLAGSTTKYSSNYTQNLTFGSDVDLSACGSASLSFMIRLDDDPNFSPSSDKSERLYVQCSGDGGNQWQNLLPDSWPSKQSACATSYCSGGNGSSRSFPWTSQRVTLPSSCRTATVRFRFQAKGANVWRLMDPGWWLDSVVVN